MPDIGHLLTPVYLFHQVVVEIVRFLLALSRPDDELRGVGEVSARYVWRRISLCPSDYVQNLVSQFVQTIGHGEDVVISTRNPDGAVVFKFVPTKRKPFLVEVHHLLRAFSLIPITLIHTYNLTRLHAYSSIGEEIRRVRKDAAELKFKFTKQTETIAMKKGEVAIERFVVGGNHFSSVGGMGSPNDSIIYDNINTIIW